MDYAVAVLFNDNVFIVTTMELVKQYELNNKYNSLVIRAKELIQQMESINNYLNRGLNEKNMNLLSIGDVNRELFKTVHLIYDVICEFNIMNYLHNL